MNATLLLAATSEPAPTADRGRPLPTARLIGAYLAEARYESLRMLRAPAFALPFLVLPVAIYLMFGVMMAAPGIAKNPRVADFLFLGFATMAVMGPALFGMGCTLASERGSGLLKLKRALPVPPGAYLLSKFLMSMFFAVIGMVLMIAAALLAGKLTLSAGQLAGASAVLILGSIPFCAMGLLIGAYSSAGAAPAFTQLVYQPMMWLSGIFIPLPDVMQKFVVIWPAFHVDQIALHVADVEGFKFMPPAIAVAVLLGITVACGGAAIRRLARKG